MSTDAGYGFIMDTADHDLMAELLPVNHYVMPFVNPPEGGTVSGEGQYQEGTLVTVTATPNTGWQFVNWTEGESEVSTDAAYTFTLGPYSRDLAANFALLPGYHLVTVEANGEGYGSVSGGGIYQEHDKVTVTATAYSNYEFVNWTLYDGPGVSTNTSYRFRMPAENLYLEANFEQGWPNGIRLSTTKVTGTSVTLALSEPVSWAQGYRIAWEGGYMGFGSVEWTGMRITGLYPASSYTFTLSAQDTFGDWIIGGPSRKVRTRK